MASNWIKLSLLVLWAAPACTREPVCASCPACSPSIVVVTATRVPLTVTIPSVIIPAVIVPEATLLAVRVAEERAPPAAKVLEPAVAKPEAEAPTPAVEAPLSDGRVRNAREYFATLERRFQPGASKDLHAVFQFDLTGPNACAYQVAVHNGSMKIDIGRATKADVTIAASAEDYVKVVNGEMDGFGAVVRRQMKIGGSLTLARRMSRLFPPRYTSN